MGMPPTAASVPGPKFSASESMASQTRPVFRSISSSKRTFHENRSCCKLPKDAEYVRTLLKSFALANGYVGCKVCKHCPAAEDGTDSGDIAKDLDLGATTAKPDPPEVEMRLSETVMKKPYRNVKKRATKKPAAMLTRSMSK